MWSGALGSTHDSSARGPGFDSHPDPDGFFGNLPSPFFQTTDLKTISFICILWCQVEINNIIILFD